MSGWVPLPAKVWPLVCEQLAQPWDKEVAAFDLRWHFDQDGTLPSRGKLAERWGWTRDEVRTLLRHPERWWDAHKGPAPTSRDTLTQRDPARPTLTQADPTDTAEPVEPATSDPARPSLTQSDPASPQARRVPPSQPPPPSQGEEQQHAGRAGGDLVLLPTAEPPVDPLDEAYLQAATYWGEVVHRQIGRRPSHGPARTTKAGRALEVALRRDSELVLDALRFVAESQTERAARLREYDGLTVETVLRHLDEYAELWRAHGDRPTGRPQERAGPGPPRRGQSTAGDGVLADLRRKFQEEGS